MYSRGCAWQREGRPVNRAAFSQVIPMFALLVIDTKLRPLGIIAREGPPVAGPSGGVAAGQGGRDRPVVFRQGHSCIERSMLCNDLFPAPCRIRRAIIRGVDEGRPTGVHLRKTRRRT